MLEYGFSGWTLFSPLKKGDALGMEVPVKLDGRDGVSVVSGGEAALLLRRGEEKKVTLEAALRESVTAPVRQGDLMGEIRVKKDGKTVLVLPALAGEAVELPGILNALLRIRSGFMLKTR